MKKEEIELFESPEELASGVASELAKRLAELVSSQESVQLVLTGGTVGIKTLAALQPLIQNLELGRLELWWGDERFLPRESPERNFVQANNALLSKLSLKRARVHEMPADEDGDLIQAAAKFAEEISLRSPKLDIVLLGLGQDGHVASLFPESNAEAIGEWVIAEANSPKVPSERISLSYSALNSAREVWFLVAGEDKAQAVSQVLKGADIPASRVRGRIQTRWFLDRAAASKLIT